MIRVRSDDNTRPHLCVTRPHICVIKEVTDSDGDIVLFIDEIHTLVGAGGGAARVREGAAGGPYRRVAAPPRCAAARADTQLGKLGCSAGLRAVAFIMQSIMINFGRTDLAREPYIVPTGNEWLGRGIDFSRFPTLLKIVARTFRHAMRPRAPRANTPCAMQ